MPSHFATIGLPVETQDDLNELAERASRDAVTISVKEGEYLRWAGGGGAELWLQVNSSQELIGINPHFSGQSRIRVGIVDRVHRPNDTELDGALHAWASPFDDSPDSGEYPFVFDLPDAGVYSDLQVPGIAEAQIAAFAHEITFFDSEASYYSSQGDTNVRFAAKSFIPSGMFQPSGDRNEPPLAYAILAGQVIQATTCTNPLSQRRFYWAVVETLGGTYDVVIHPDVLDREPVAGGILSGSFWLSGRLTSYRR